MDILQRTASQIHGENTALTQLARQGHKDSKMLKILSVVATLYLPASLIAVSGISWRIENRRLIFLDSFQF
jgi:Mg2+ and Co2+ transporter CorA